MEQIPRPDGISKRQWHLLTHPSFRSVWSGTTSVGEREICVRCLRVGLSFDQSELVVRSWWSYRGVQADENRLERALASAWQLVRGYVVAHQARQVSVLGARKPRLHADAVIDLMGQRGGISAVEVAAAFGASRAAADQILHRLVASGLATRACRGVYQRVEHVADPAVTIDDLRQQEKNILAEIARRRAHNAEILAEVQADRPRISQREWDRMPTDVQDTIEHMFGAPGRLPKGVRLFKTSHLHDELGSIAQDLHEFEIEQVAA